MEHKDYRLAAVMFTDIVGFSRMMEEDEKGTLQTLDFHNKLVREQIEKHRGTVIKTIGDAFLAQFNTTLDAVSCSLDVQEGIREYNESAIGKTLTLRIGVHMGDIYFYENDALGEGINIASRLQSVTKPGHITISREVYSQVSGKIPMRVESLGQVHLKNITREVHAYEIIPGGEDNNSIEFVKQRSDSTGSLPEETRQTPPEQGRNRSAAPTEDRSQGPFPNDWPSFQPLRERPAGPPPSFSDLKAEWKSLKGYIKSQVKESLTGAESWKDAHHRVRSRYRENKAQFVADFFRDPSSVLRDENGNPVSAFKSYKEKQLRHWNGSRAGVGGHLSAYVSVNAFLMFINFTTSPGFFWFLFPLLGWGIGLCSHLAAHVSMKRTVKELEQLEDLNDQDYKTLKKFQGARTGFLAHIVSNAAIAGFMYVISAITGSGLLWPSIVTAALGMGVVSHFGGYAAQKRGFKDFWKRIRLGGNTGPQPRTPVEPGEDPIVAKARALKDSIVSQAQGMKGGNPFGEDMTLTLDNYVKQIAELSTIEKEINRVVLSFNASELESEEVIIRQKIDKTGSNTLKLEYEKSLSEIEKQKKSVGDLTEQQEILSLRLNSAMKNLQQMQIDLARIKGLSDGQKEGYFLSLKGRSEELSRYIEDYREGLKEVP